MAGMEKYKCLLHLVTPIAFAAKESLKAREEVRSKTPLFG
jgi:hypothetical protein